MLLYELYKQNNGIVSGVLEWEGCLVGREGKSSPRASLIEKVLQLLNPLESERRRKSYERLELSRMVMNIKADSSKLNIKN